MKNVKKINSKNEIIINLLFQEWKTTIETQMHFNDLILRFRSIVLSVFIAGLGVIYGLGDFLINNSIKLDCVYILPIVFWFSCFIIDFFYYQKLLNGSVEHVNKFEKMSFFKENKLLGLTTSISNKISNIKSNFLIFLFYAIPLFTIISLVYFD